MKLYLNQLASHLKQPLAPIYFISGDETLLVQEARDAFLGAARQQGFDEHEFHHVDKKFDWNSLYAATHNLSLFSDKTVIELRMLSSKPGTTGAKALTHYAANPVDDKILLIISPKVESATSKTKWYKSLETAGVTLPIWPIDKPALGKWVMERMHGVGISSDNIGVKLIIDATEGNLLATAQEIEKLRLLYGPGKLSAEQVASAIADNARFDVFQLTDTIHRGDGAHVLRVLTRLRQEGTEPTLIVWALARELRTLINVKTAVEQGSQSSQALRQNGVWDKRQPLIKQALSKHTKTKLLQLLKHISNIDLTIKGLRPGHVWDELSQLSLNCAGIKL